MMVVLMLLTASNEGTCTLRHFVVQRRRANTFKLLDGDDEMERSTSSNTAPSAEEARVTASDDILLGCSHSVTKCVFRNEKYMHRMLQFVRKRMAMILTVWRLPIAPRRGGGWFDGRRDEGETTKKKWTKLC